MAKKMQINISKIANDILKKQLNEYAQAGKSAMKEIRTSIVNEWFGSSYSSVSMNVATNYTSYTRMFSDNTAQVIIHSWVDVGNYNPSQNIQNWNIRNEYGLDPVFLMEYVLDLQLEKGIIGLPKEGAMTNTGWTNDNFHQQEPLRKYIENHTDWGKFKSKVNEYIK